MIWWWNSGGIPFLFAWVAYFVRLHCLLCLPKLPTLFACIAYFVFLNCLLCLPELPTLFAWIAYFVCLNCLLCLPALPTLFAWIAYFVCLHCLLCCPSNNCLYHLYRFQVKSLPSSEMLIGCTTCYMVDKDTASIVNSDYNQTDIQHVHNSLLKRCKCKYTCVGIFNLYKVLALQMKYLNFVRTLQLYLILAMQLFPCKQRVISAWPLLHRISTMRLMSSQTNAKSMDMSDKQLMYVY